MEAREPYLGALEVPPDDFESTAWLTYSSSSRKHCDCLRTATAGCPELFDPDRSVRFSMRAFEVYSCRTEWLPTFEAETAGRIDRFERIEAAIAQAIEGAGVDEQVVRMERATRALVERRAFLRSA